jgi:hypothetical protein
MGGGYGDKAPKEDPFRWERRGEIDANRWRRPIFFIQPLEDHSCGQSELWQPGICDPDNPHSTRFKHGESYRSRVRLVRTERPDRNWWTAALMVYKTVTIFPRPRGWLSTRAMISGHKILNGRIVDQQAYNPSTFWWVHQCLHISSMVEAYKIAGQTLKDIQNECKFLVHENKTCKEAGIDYK